MHKNEITPAVTTSDTKRYLICCSLVNISGGITPFLTSFKQTCFYVKRRDSLNFYRFFMAILSDPSRPLRSHLLLRLNIFFRSQNPWGSIRSLHQAPSRLSTSHFGPLKIFRFPSAESSRILLFLLPMIKSFYSLPTDS